ncbi:hypothetical protein H920_06976 [Fukomys damarensis]|uniref:Uncharacterized protein n=1 Tax=Fukomys damarensis TaxID=885580 RepID=A0A091DMT9_FUKDA|nr:hypothetical protein H920_06976 [Fukomys damarensis]
MERLGGSLMGLRQDTVLEFVPHMHLSLHTQGFFSSRALQTLSHLCAPSVWLPTQLLLPPSIYLQGQALVPSGRPEVHGLELHQEASVNCRYPGYPEAAAQGYGQLQARRAGKGASPATSGHHGCHSSYSGAGSVTSCHLLMEERCGVKGRGDPKDHCVHALLGTLLSNRPPRSRMTPQMPMPQSRPPVADGEHGQHL